MVELVVVVGGDVVVEVGVVPLGRDVLARECGQELAIYRTQASGP